MSVEERTERKRRELRARLRERRRRLKLRRLMAAADAAGCPVFAATEGKRAKAAPGVRGSHGGSGPSPSPCGKEAAGD